MSLQLSTDQVPEHLKWVFPETLLFGRVSPVQKIFNGFGSCNYIVTQQRAPNLKFSSHMDYICRKYVVKVKENLAIWTKINYNWPYLLLRPKIPQNIVKPDFSPGSKKSNLFSLCGPNISFVYYLLYKSCPKICWHGARKWSIFELSYYINAYNFKSIIQFLLQNRNLD